MAEDRKNERLAALEQIEKEFEKQFGKGSLVRLGDANTGGAKKAAQPPDAAKIDTVAAANAAA